MHNQFITNLKAQRASLLEQIHLIDEMLKLNGVSIDEVISEANTTSNSIPYKKDDSWQSKFASLIKSTNRFLSINEAATMVNSFEPKISLEEAKKGLGSGKNSLLKNNVIAKFQVGNNNSNSFYGSPSWLNSDGSIKEEHKYDESAVQARQTVMI